MPQMQEFYVIIERDEDGYYVADVPELPGCHTQAKSLGCIAPQGQGGHRVVPRGLSAASKVLEEAGFQFLRQKGSHALYAHPDGRVTEVPLHRGEDIGRGLLRKIIRDMKISREEFSKLL